MKAALFKGKGAIELGERPDPSIKEPTDAVVRVVLASVCGSDLWFYRGVSDYTPGSPVGHEFIGVVEQVGKSVQTIAKGDLVIAPFFYSEGTLVKVPGSGHADETLASLLTLSDVMCTGHHAVVSAEVKQRDTVAVIGDGAVGLCAIIAAKRLGAQRIIALSRNPARQALARAFGAKDILVSGGKEANEAVLSLTDGVGIDAALECVGTNEAMQTALSIARPGSIVGYVGVPHGVEIPVPTLFFRNNGAHGGPANVRAYIPELLDDVVAGRVFDFTTELDGIAQAYAVMDERRAIKSLVKVGTV